MNTTHGAIRRGGVAFLTLALVVVMSGAFTAGAQAGPDKEPDRTLNDHPSGKDRTAKPGGSTTQGKSTSDPDGDTNGGADKPGGDGGFDADKDGNNGCGNDDDFEDDNNGNCGGRRVAVLGSQKIKDKDVTTTKSTTAHDEVVTLNGVVMDREARVLGVALVREQAASISGTAAANGNTAVLGTSFSRSSGTLAATGAPILLWAAFGLLLISAGGLAVRATD